MILAVNSNKNAFPEWHKGDNNLNANGTYAKVWMHAAYENSGEEKLFNCPVFENADRLSKMRAGTHKGVENYGYFVNGTTVLESDDNKERPIIYPTYGFNHELQGNGLKTSLIRKPSKSLMLGCCYYWEGGGYCGDGNNLDENGYLKGYLRCGTGGSLNNGDYANYTCHGKSWNITYIDGHVDSVDWHGLRIRAKNSTTKYGGKMLYGYYDLTTD